MLFAHQILVISASEAFNVTFQLVILAVPVLLKDTFILYAPVQLLALASNTNVPLWAGGVDVAGALEVTTGDGLGTSGAVDVTTGDGLGTSGAFEV